MPSGPIFFQSYALILILEIVFTMLFIRQDLQPTLQPEHHQTAYFPHRRYYKTNIRCHCAVGLSELVDFGSLELGNDPF